ncbi:hypothetical protein HMPREF9420_2525 [Segatella salivae DSM 15606]|uniref:Uncharacterized protein n=1 Tax=Segatella salivae DSM 15606 TaxID=888832 RepID=E6MSQ7_9BACT|nr:hypothetical protein HMPREF9420_2525 [Segatella salivae DSM 15606]
MYCFLSILVSKTKVFSLELFPNQQQNISQKSMVFIRFHYALT